MAVADERPEEPGWEGVAAVYADGGVVLKNPSPHGGTWAYRLVDAEGGAVHGAAGYLTPAEVGLPWVSNNLTEFVAVLVALEQLPDRWAGPVYSDSLNAIRAHRDAAEFPAPPKYLPGPLWERARAIHGRITVTGYVLLGGHPTRAELAAGVRKDGKPVSEHNVWCDRQCGEMAARLLAESNLARAGEAG